MTSDVGLRSERGPILLAIMVATGLVAIDSTILATAVPSIVDDIGGFSQFPWLFSIYLLAQAVTVPIYSKLADTIGRKPIILVGIALFLLGSILCGLRLEHAGADRVPRGAGSRRGRGPARSRSRSSATSTRSRSAPGCRATWPACGRSRPSSARPSAGVFAQFTAGRGSSSSTSRSVCSRWCCWCATSTRRSSGRSHRIDYRWARCC